MSKSEKEQAASIVWFEIPADNPERAKAFYSNLFGWKINPFPGGGDYWHIDTGGAGHRFLQKNRETRWQDLPGENSCTTDGLFRCVPGYRGKLVWNLAK
jgi:catechol 2,3-dioxygenase-like lactoylglutathione lyase family enzyme